MPNHNDIVRGFVAGDDLSIRRRLTNTVAADPLLNAWLTVRDSKDDTTATVIFLKGPIDTIGNSSGIIEDNGSTNGTAIVRFDLGPADTRLVGIGFYFDIQVRTVAVKTYTPIKGTIRAVGEVTSA